MRFNFIKKLLVASAIASTAVIFSACSETSVIEAENEILSEHKGPKKGSPGFPGSQLGPRRSV